MKISNEELIDAFEKGHDGRRSQNMLIQEFSEARAS